ncbi:MarR family winged helix-turn-helix transcriptional regulator [Paenibacillus thalictri]|uniref:MarR family transcriptional regulator n=1 Tax=Paenibacillus thalictri TaxID=2527873 RepID=A0A4V2J302_9BACL|nr:MarR family transcriptional regulator [Paenibacillus thalictri]TBL68542.1 MarR family transcriptional regulator [Paenibacillus thalictri]
MISSDFVKVWSKLSKEIHTYMDSQLSPALTEGQLNVLELLSSNDRMKPSDFIDYLATTPAAITTLLDRMEKGELIVRERDEKDRRIVWVIMTEKGQRECARGLGLREEFIRQYLSRISSHNQQLLVYLLGKMAG